MTQANAEEWLEQVKWNADGLIPAITQDYTSGRVLTLAWMNRTALQLTCAEGRAVYWSRSRGRLWRKGEQSGHVQEVREIRLDCDHDTLLLRVDQHGGIACHTGRESCFYLQKTESGWEETDPVIKDPAAIYDK
jgi:phosphoribosyl-AMP cyclohydrolase